MRCFYPSLSEGICWCQNTICFDGGEGGKEGKVMTTKFAWSFYKVNLELRVQQNYNGNKNGDKQTNEEPQQDLQQLIQSENMKSK